MFGELRFQICLVGPIRGASLVAIISIQSNPSRSGVHVLFPPTHIPFPQHLLSDLTGTLTQRPSLPIVMAIAIPTSNNYFSSPSHPPIHPTLLITNGLAQLPLTFCTLVCTPLQSRSEHRTQLSNQPVHSCTLVAYTPTTNNQVLAADVRLGDAPEGLLLRVAEGGAALGCGGGVGEDACWG